MGIPRAKSRSYTYADYLTWTGPDRVELIDGTVYDMRPAPSRRHQAVSGELFKQIAVFLTDRPCRVYAAPFDVRLPDAGSGLADDTTTSVVQPDISVFCSEKQLDDKGAKGPPDLVVEILSPSTSSKDSIVKRDLYERHGVAEYWIVDPETRSLYQFVLDNGRYAEPRELVTGMALASQSLPGVQFTVDEVFR